MASDWMEGLRLHLKMFCPGMAVPDGYGEFIPGTIEGIRQAVRPICGHHFCSFPSAKTRAVLTIMFRTLKPSSSSVI